MAYVALRDLGPHTPYYKHLYFCLLCFGYPALGILSLAWEFMTIPDHLSVEGVQLSSSSFYQGQKLHQMWMTEELAMFNLWERDFGGEWVGEWRETIDGDLSKYLESRQMKNAVTQEQKSGVEEEKSGEKKWNQQAVGKQLQTYSPKRLLL